MYAQRRSEVTIPPSNYSGNAFRYPPPTPLPPLTREGAEEASVGGGARSLEQAIPMEAVRSAGVSGGARLEDGEEAASAEYTATPAREDGRLADGVADAAKEASRISFGAWRGILQNLGGEELLLLGVLLLVTGEEGGTVLPLCLLLLLLCG
jgi:hypothetical protein